MGKSNSGKSSLINAILNTDVCNVSKNPVELTRDPQNTSTSMI
jgi:GTP-binding protein EngB required for normal cell division